MKNKAVKITAAVLSALLLFGVIPLSFAAGFDSVCLGSYPQSLVGDSSLTAALDSMVSDDDWVSYGYYSNNSPADYMFYADKYLNGEKYRGVCFSLYRPTECNQSAGNEGTRNYGQLNYNKNSIYWFRYEPIKWYVLDYDSGLVVSEYALDCMEFRADNSDKNYSTSDIKEWLENNFTETSFTTEELAAISGNAKLLSVEQCENSALFPTSSERVAATTQYSEMQNCYYASINGEHFTFWWTSSAVENSLKAYTIGFMGAKSSTELNKIYGVRPALNIDLSKAVPSDSTQHTIYYTLYNTDGSVYSTYSERYNTGSPVTAYVPEVEGIFSGWNDTVPSVMPDHDLYYCSTVQGVQYTITYIIGNGEDDIVNSYTAGETIIKPADPIREHYSFKGWNTAVPETMPAESITITALWEINKHDVIYIVDSQEYEKISDVAYGTAVPGCTKGNPEKEGYKFTGWDSIPASMPDEDLVINACFEIESYTITYILNNGEENIVTEYNFGQQVEKPDNPVYEGHSFSGWSIEPPNTMPARNLEIEARWDTVLYTLTFDFDCEKENETRNYEFGEEISGIPVPERTGYIFEGWSPEIPATMPANNLTVKAKWKIVPETHTHNFIYETTDTHHWLVCACGEKKAYEKHSFTWKTEKEPTATKQGLTKGICSKCGYCITKAIPPLGNPVINAPAGRKIAYRSNIKVKATGKDIPSDCRLVLFAGNKPVRYGDNSKVEYEAEDIRDNISFTVKVMGKTDNKVRNDSNGKPLIKYFDVTMNKGFFQRIIAFFVHLFKLTKTEKFEPAA